GRLIQRLEGHTGRVFSVAISPDGAMLASGSDDEIICLWETKTDRLIQRLEGHTNWVRSVAFSPDGNILASGSDDRTICLWETKTGRLIQRLEGHTGWVWSVVISPDGRILISGSDDGTIRFFRISDGKEIIAFAARDKDWVSFTPEGYYIGEGNFGRFFSLVDKIVFYFVDDPIVSEEFNKPELVCNLLTG
ncbi:MAG: WD40 repeat domain-containing protein, partial [bacterium]